MPFKSDKQRRYLFANEPEIAKRWSNMYNKIKGLGAVKKQGYKDREDESIAMRRGKEKGKKQSYKDRRNESYGKFGKRDFEKRGKNKINITGLGAIKPTISEIKSRTLKKAPYFFSKNTMKFFGQRMSDYKVKRSPKGRIFIYAPTYDDLGNKMPYTFMEFKNDDLIAQSGIYDSETEIKKYISKK